MTRGWLLAAVGVIAAMLVCILLGLWQFHRYEAKSARADLIARNYDAEPAPLDALLPDPTTPLSSADEWRTATLRGEYCTDASCVLYVRNRPLNSQVGFLQLVPFRTDDGTVIVSRGWVPTQEQDAAPLDPPAPPTGEQTVVVRLRPVEQQLAHRSNPAGQVQTIDPVEVGTIVPGLDRLHTGAYGQMVSESPGAAQVPLPPERPDSSLGPHLSYAVQWWAFAAFFPIAWVVRARRAVLDERADADDCAAGAPGTLGTVEPKAPRDRAAAGSRARPAPARAPSRRRTRDEEEEDALLDRRR
ncbi:SURF1 family cytochrome oxidase biogenesis protein [Brachybacterium huguangmaarense]